MKIKSFLSALLSLSLLSFGLHAWADDNEQDDQGHNQDEQGEDCHGGDIDGSETLVAIVTLVPTTNAPVDASGVAKLISENEDGVVSFAGIKGGYGNVVEIDHGNGYMTRYAHNSQNLATVGQRVRVGEVIAKVGSTGRSTGSHVHFEVWLNGKAVNPIAYVRSQRKV